MVRRKPLVVQRKRPRSVSPDNSELSRSRSQDTRAGDALDNSESATESDEIAAHDDDATNITSSRPSKRPAHRLHASKQPNVALSFRDQWTPARRADALTLSFSPTPHAHEELVATLERLSGRRVGLEVIDGSKLALRDAGDDAVAETALTLSDVFVGVDSEGLAHVLQLVEKELLLLELSLHSRIGAATEIRLHASVAWRDYSAVPRKTRQVEFPQPHRLRHRTAVSLWMHQTMLWLLVAAHNADSEQCAFPYWQEIDTLLADAFGPDVASIERSAVQHNAFDIHDVYARIDVQRQLRRDPSDYRLASAAAGSNGGAALVPTLRPYQEAAVSWMLARETGDGLPRADQPLHVCFPQRHSALVYDPFRARFYETNGSSDRTTDCEDESDDPFFPDGPPLCDLSAVRGGILADEMGLGKTVEVIALVLSHPWPELRPMLLSQHAPPVERTDDSMERSCICGCEDDDTHGWLQCSWCLRWHHRLCTGYAERSSTDRPDDSAPTDQPPPLFMCYHCQPVWRPEISCKTTLIVSPEAISDQWARELTRHTQPGALTVFKYTGVHLLHRRLESLKRPSAEWQVLANAGLYLASFDVILTTYEVLSADLHHVPSDTTLERRASTRQRTKKYAFLASPLLYLRFWRVCMDEAQVGVENTHLRAALTVAELRAELKWVVTGTPFSTQLSDLYGCLKFLRVAPFDDDSVGAAMFTHVLEHGFERGAHERLLDLLLWDGHSASSGTGRRRHSGGGLLWRTGKRDVRQQLGLPEQTTDVVWCRLSEVERHFYDEKEKAIVAKVNAYQRRRGAAGVTDAIWQDLLVLRQICCHPQVGSTLSGSALSLRSVGRAATAAGDRSGVLSMDAFLRGLIAKCRRQCEEEQRKLLAATNALAGLDLIDNQRLAAMAKYLASLQLIQRHWPLFRADMLPRLHILVNLARCARTVFGLEGSDDDDGNDREADAAEVLTTASVNAKEHSFLPDVLTLTGAVDLYDTEDAVRARTVVAAVARDCVALDASARCIRRSYLNQSEAAHDAARSAFQAITDAVDADVRATRAKRPVLCSPSLWWLSALAALERQEPEHAEEFVQRVRDRLLASDTLWARHFDAKFRSLAGFRVAFLDELEELAKSRAALYTTVQQLSSSALSKDDVTLSGNCARCRDSGSGPTCAQCKLDNELHAYWQHLQGESTRAIAKSRARWTAIPTVSRRNKDVANTAENTDVAAGGRTMSPSLVAELFREIAAAARAMNSPNPDPDAPTPQDGLRDEQEFWGRIQKEWTAASKLVQVQRQRLGALDELDMATTLVRLQHDGEVVTSTIDKGYKLLRSAVPTKRLASESERVAAKLKLDEKMAQLRYLEQLEQQQQKPPQQTGAAVAATASQDCATTDSDDARTNQCAVCFEKLANERVMLPCAHVFCTSCVQKLVKARAISGSVRCPMCRLVCSASQVAVVVEDAERAAAKLATSRRASTRPVADAHITLMRGGFGSKVDSVVRRVCALALENPRVKCLLFTQWGDMVYLITKCLEYNNIQCFEYTSTKEFPRMAQHFKNTFRPCVLAMPFKVGANGLNLVEATEVLLVEPLLNTSIEAQAINRVHRIGQTKPTRVHRFVVDYSVEERIFWLGQKKKSVKRVVSRQRTDHAVGSDETESEPDHDNDNADDNAVDTEDDTVDRVPSKKEKEELSLSELHVLLDGKLRDTVRHGDTEVADDDNDDNDDERLHPFWDDRVVLNGRPITRLEAKQRIEQRQAAERRAREQSTEPPPLPPLTHLFNLELNVAVAHEVVHLANASELEEARAISTELLAFHCARLLEELDLWRAAS